MAILLLSGSANGGHLHPEQAKEGCCRAEPKGSQVIGESSFVRLGFRRSQGLPGLILTTTPRADQAIGTRVTSRVVIGDSTFVRLGCRCGRPMPNGDEKTDGAHEGGSAPAFRPVMGRPPRARSHIVHGTKTRLSKILIS